MKDEKDIQNKAFYFETGFGHIILNDMFDSVKFFDHYEIFSSLDDLEAKLEKIYQILKEKISELKNNMK